MFENYEYLVKVEGKVLRTAFNYGGLVECQRFINHYGKDDKKYKIRVVKKETK